MCNCLRDRISQKGNVKTGGEEVTERGTRKVAMNETKSDP